MYCLHGVLPLTVHAALRPPAAGMFALKQDVSVMGARAAYQKRVASGRYITPNTSMQSNRSVLSSGTAPPSLKSVRFR